MHSHGDVVCTFLTECRFKVTYPDGKTEDINAKAGDILPYGAFEHLPENVSDKPLRGDLSRAEEVAQIPLRWIAGRHAGVPEFALNMSRTNAG